MGMSSHSPLGWLLLGQTEPRVASARIPSRASVLHPRAMPQADTGPELDIPKCSCVGSYISALPIFLHEHRQGVLQTALASKMEAFK